VAAKYGVALLGRPPVPLAQWARDFSVPDRVASA
jgi:hypothetical protein